MDYKIILDVIITTSKSDCRLARLYGKTEEYAQVYLFAKKRQKGCDGLGEMTNLKDEFKIVFDELIAYCKKSEYLDDTGLYDMEAMAEQIIIARHKNS